MDTKNEYLLKITIVGTPLIHIEKMIHKFTGWKGSTPELGVEIATKKIPVDNSYVKLILPYPTLPYTETIETRPQYYRGSSAVFICFDKSDKESYKTAIKDILQDVRKHLPDPKIPFALIGFTTNSKDETPSNAEELANKKNMSYFELNPTDKIATENVMRHLTRLALAAKESTS
jgi:GTPase SAR1 family protein